jgi:predicted transcriptional regulator
MQEQELREKLVSLLGSGPGSSAEFAKSLGASEDSVLSVLQKLCAERLVQCMVGEWSLISE